MAQLAAGASSLQNLFKSLLNALCLTRRLQDLLLEWLCLWLLLLLALDTRNGSHLRRSLTRTLLLPSHITPHSLTLKGCHLRLGRTGSRKSRRVTASGKPKSWMLLYIPKYQQDCDILFCRHRLLTKILIHNACYSLFPRRWFLCLSMYMFELIHQ